MFFSAWCELPWLRGASSMRAASRWRGWSVMALRKLSAEEKEDWGPRNQKGAGNWLRPPL